MQTIANKPTADDFSPALTVEDDEAETLTYVIANASVIAQFRAARRESGGIGSYSPNILLTPEKNVVPHCSGAKFKSAVAGDPARVIAFLTSPDDPQIGAGVPFAGVLSASGDVSLAAITTFGVQSSAGLALAQADAALAGTAVSFTVIGSQARMLVVYEFDFNITVAGGGLCLGRCVLDGGAGIGPSALFDPGGGVGRATVGQTTELSIAAGAHSLELVARKTNAGGTATAEAGARISVILVDK